MNAKHTIIFELILDTSFDTLSRTIFELTHKLSRTILKFAHKDGTELGPTA